MRENVAVAGEVGVLHADQGRGCAVTGWPSLLSPPTIVGAFVFSGLVGIFFGYSLAQTASRLDPIASLRHE